MIPETVIAVVSSPAGNIILEMVTVMVYAPVLVSPSLAVVKVNYYISCNVFLCFFKCLLELMIISSLYFMTLFSFLLNIDLKKGKLIIMIQ